MRSWLGGEPTSPPAAPPRKPAPATPPGQPVKEQGDRNAQLLEDLAQRDKPLAPAEQAAALDAFERLVVAGREVLALDLGRRLLARLPSPELRCRIAERLDARGDESGALEVLAPLVSAPEGPLDALMLAAEIAERRSDRSAALTLYERIVAREVDYPRARERAARLREEQRTARRDDGATLMAEGGMSGARYRLTRELGRGGAGTVFLAEDQQLGRKVALKVYHRRGRADRERLLLEARTAASLEHPGVVRIYDVEEPLAAIAMEVVEGGSVRAELRKGPVALARVLVWMHSALAALEMVHRAGIVHRDLKPANLLLRPDDQVVLTDFGVALPIGGAGASATANAEGTLAYMPPEQRAGAPAATSMDVHAMGALIRELLGQLVGEAPPELVEIAAASMRAEPQDRPSVAELRAWLPAAPR